MILFLASLAFAGDITVVQPGQTYKATDKVFVLPEPMYDTCLAKAEALRATEIELERAGQEILEANATARAALDACSTSLAMAQQDNLLLRKDLKIVRQQRTFLILGSAALAAVIAGETYVLIEMAR